MSVSEEKHCTPCRGEEEPLQGEALESSLARVPEWECAEDETAISRIFTFKNYKMAWALVNDISTLAEQEKHHPDIAFGWGYCNVTLQTHSIGGLHENDFIMAEAINKLAEKDR